MFLADLRAKVGFSHTRSRGFHPSRRQTPPGTVPTGAGRGPGYPIRSIFRDNPLSCREAYIVTVKIFDWDLYVNKKNILFLPFFFLSGPFQGGHFFGEIMKMAVDHGGGTPP